MPKYQCKCGITINLSEIPSPNQFMIISDVEMDQFTGSVESEDVYRSMKIVANCPNCHRLHIFWEGFNENPSTYVKEN